jgi:kynurenine aminotransferase
VPRYISNIEIRGVKVVYVAMHAPPEASTKTISAAEWHFDIEELKQAVTQKTKIIVLNSPSVSNQLFPLR